MAVCNSKASLEKKRRRRHKRRGDTTRGDHRGCDPAEDNASTDNIISQESPNTICLNMEPEMGQSHLEVNLLEEKNEKKHDSLQCGEASGISVLTILNVEGLKEEETSPNADFCSADGKENSLVPEDPNGKGTNMVKRDDEHTETVDHSTPSSHVETQRVRKRKRRRGKGKSLESSKKILESNVEDEKEVSPMSHPHEAETTSHLKDLATEEVMNGVLLEESIDCSISEKTELLSTNTKDSSMVIADPHWSKDFENTTTIKKDDDCLETKGCLAQSNSDVHGKTKREKKKRRRRRKFADTLEGSLNSDVEDNNKDATFNCSNEVDATSLHEHSTTTEIVKNVLVACDATNDNISAVLEKHSLSQISNSSNERDTTSLSKKKLLILDVNGLLVDFVPYSPDGYTPDIVISRKAGERKHILDATSTFMHFKLLIYMAIFYLFSVFKRPFCDDFLRFCFERFEVGIWSSRTW